MKWIIVCCLLPGFLTVFSVTADISAWRPAGLSKTRESPADDKTETKVGCWRDCSCFDEGYVVCNNQNHRTVPDGLPPDTRTLYLDFNSLTSLTGFMFRNLSLLDTFSAKNNGIEHVAKHTFGGLVHMRKIDLTQNPLSLTSMKNIFCSRRGTSYVELYLGAVFEKHQQRLSAKNLRCLKAAPGRIRILSLENNHFARFPDGLFEGLDIETLVLRNTTKGVFNIKSLKGIRRLAKLDLSMNGLRDFPVFLSEGLSLVPNLTVLSVGDNAFRHLNVERMGGLDGLESLSVNNILDVAMDFNVEAELLRALPSLRSFEFQNNPFELISEEGTMLYSTSLTYLDVSYLKLYGKQPKASLDDITLDMFNTVPNLTRLVASNLHFPWHWGVEKNLYFSKAFQNLLKLIDLDLSSNGLTSIYIGMFKGLEKLQKLDLSQNLLTEWHHDVFSGLISLTDLDLSGNAVSFLTKDFFLEGGKSLTSLASVNLGGNPFSCTCELLWLKRVLRDQPWLFMLPETYKCVTPSAHTGIPLLDTNLDVNNCSHLFSVAFYIVTAAIWLLTFVILSLIYRFRWHVKFCFLQIKSKYIGHLESADSQYYTYDVFVSYHSTSLRWLKYCLLPLLEHKFGLKVCIHDRDWLAGNYIVDNIVESVTGSRKVIVVVSNAFARSQWCMLELILAQNFLLERDKNNLIVILLEDIHYDNMTPRLALQMKTRTYLEWNEDPKARKCFEERLRNAMTRSSQSSRLVPV